MCLNVVFCEKISPGEIAIAVATSETTLRSGERWWRLTRRTADGAQPLSRERPPASNIIPTHDPEMNDADPAGGREEGERAFARAHACSARVMTQPSFLGGVWC